MLLAFENAIVDSSTYRHVLTFIILYRAMRFSYLSLLTHQFCLLFRSILLNIFDHGHVCSSTSCCSVLSCVQVQYNIFLNLMVYVFQTRLVWFTTVVSYLKFRIAQFSSMHILVTEPESQEQGVIQQFPFQVLVLVFKLSSWQREGCCIGWIIVLL